MLEITCPNCGDAVRPAISGLKMASCASCGTALLLQDDAAKLAGEQGVMHDTPLLFGIGDTVTGARRDIVILGHARFSYGRGFWDEFWGTDDTGTPLWVSVDEGDIVVQHKVDTRTKIDASAQLGAKFHMSGQDFTVTEKETAECVALRGSFDEMLQVGETFTFLNCTGADGELASGEFWPGGHAWFIGEWIDPFDVKVARADGTAS